MLNPQQPINPWIVSYITQHRKNLNRYEIDKYLIELGHDQVEIEQGWLQVIASSKRSQSAEIHIESGWGFAGGVVCCFFGVSYIFSRIDMIGTGLDKSYSDTAGVAGIIWIAIGIVAIIGATREYKTNLTASAYMQLGASFPSFLLYLFIGIALKQVDLGIIVIGLLLTGGVKTLKKSAAATKK